MNLRLLNRSILGLFVGYLTGQILVLILRSVLQIGASASSLQGLEMLQGALFVLGVCLGCFITFRAADDFYVSIPFVQFTPTIQKKKDLLLEASVLADPRIIDLASSGLLDHQLVLPRFLIKDLYEQAEMVDEGIRTKAKKSLEVIKKLETIQDLELRYSESDFPELQDPFAKQVRLARLMDANILTADALRLQTEAIEGLRVINLHTLANALKPSMQAGEKIKIKVQRYGKEPRQGVGYLDDGAMVVINGGGDYIGEMIEALVLSVKHTSSGRMIFCNTLNGEQNES